MVRYTLKNETAPGSSPDAANEHRTAVFPRYFPRYFPISPLRSSGFHGPVCDLVASRTVFTCSAVIPEL